MVVPTRSTPTSMMVFVARFFAVGSGVQKRS